METTSTKTLELDFALENGDEMKLSLPDYKADLTETQIKTASTTIIEQKAFAPGGAAPIKLKGYQFVDKEVRRATLED